MAQLLISSLSLLVVFKSGIHESGSVGSATEFRASQMTAICGLGPCSLPLNFIGTVVWFTPCFTGYVPHTSSGPMCTGKYKAKEVANLFKKNIADFSLLKRPDFVDHFSLSVSCIIAGWQEDGHRNHLRLLYHSLQSNGIRTNPSNQVSFFNTLIHI